LSLLIEEKNAEIIVKNLPEITGDKEQVGMVFTNLIKNGLYLEYLNACTIEINMTEPALGFRFARK